MVQMPVFDGDGYAIQKRGITAYPGLYFLGLPRLHNAKSGLLFGVAEDAAHIAAAINRGTQRRRAHKIAEETIAADRFLSHHGFAGVHLLSSREALPKGAMVAGTTRTFHGEGFRELSTWIGQADRSMVRVERTGPGIDGSPSPSLPVQAGEDYSSIKNRPVEGNMVTIEPGLVPGGQRQHRLATS